MSRMIEGWRRAPPRRMLAVAPMLWLAAGTLAGPLFPPLPPWTLAAQEPSSAIEQAALRYREVRAICADFAQVLENPVMRRTIESAGRICQQRPNLFSMRFTDPDGDMVISDGQYVWLYYPSSNRSQVMRGTVADSPGREDFYREFLEDPGSKYEAEEGGIEAVDGLDCRVVTLTPRAGASYRLARLWLDTERHVIRRIELHEQSGNVRTLTLSNVNLDAAPDPALFVFVVPEGARVRGPGGRGSRGPAP